MYMLKFFTKNAVYKKRFAQDQLQRCIHFCHMLTPIEYLRRPTNQCPTTFFDGRLINHASMWFHFCTGL